MDLRTRVAHTIVHLHELDQVLGDFAESVDHWGDLIEDPTRPEAPAEFAAAVPALNSCRRRLLTLAAAMTRFREKVESRPA